MRLSYGFVLGYHGCTNDVAAELLSGAPLRTSDNDYDWLGSGVYFWEANPKRGLSFSTEVQRRRRSKKQPSVVGAVIDLGLCLDLTTELGIGLVSNAYESLAYLSQEAGIGLPSNSIDLLLRRLDCAVINHLHEVIEHSDPPGFDTVRGVFTEGEPAYPTAGFHAKTHVQIAVRNLDCIKGVFRVPDHHLKA